MITQITSRMSTFWNSESCSFFVVRKGLLLAIPGRNKRRKFGQYGLGEVLGSEVKLQLISRRWIPWYMRGTTRLIRRHVHLAVCLPTVCGVFSRGSSLDYRCLFPPANSFAGFTRSSLHRAQANTKRSLNTPQEKSQCKKWKLSIKTCFLFAFKSFQELYDRTIQKEIKFLEIVENFLI